MADFSSASKISAAANSAASEIIISAAQCRAARAWLKLTQKEFAKLAKIATSTLQDFESEKSTPVLHNREAIMLALRLAGINVSISENGRFGTVSGRLVPKDPAIP